MSLLRNQTPAPPQFARLQIFVGADMCLRAHVRDWDSVPPTDLIAPSPEQASAKAAEPRKMGIA